MSVRIERLGPSDDGQLVGFLNRLAAASPQVLAYHYPVYRDMLIAIGVGEPFYLGAWKDGELAAVLPGFMRGAAVGRVYSSLPFCGPNAGVLAETAASDYRVALLDSLVGQLKAAGDVLSASIYTPFLSQEFESYDRVLAGALIVPKFTQHLGLPAAPWYSKLRCDIRHAIQGGVTTSTEVTPQRIDRFYEIYCQNCADAGIPVKPRAAVDFLADKGVAAGNVKLYFALQGGEMVSGLMVICSPVTASYYLPCTLKEKRSLQAGSLLIDAAVQELTARGLRFWNWESSPNRDSGVYRFKEKWGSKESDFRIYILPFREPEVFRSIGRDGLAAAFPYYFVYPFDRL